jgi:hypothetical protein
MLSLADRRALAAAAVRDVDVLKLEGADQLVQAHLASRLDCSDGGELLDAAAYATLRGRVAAAIASHAESSRLHAAVTAGLRHLGQSPRTEVLVLDGTRSVDILLDGVDGAPATVVEVDGPSHYMQSPWRAEEMVHKGSTHLRNRLLRGAGFALAIVNYAEWDALGGEEGAQAAYLRGVLARAWPPLRAPSRAV